MIKVPVYYISQIILKYTGTSIYWLDTSTSEFYQY